MMRSRMNQLVRSVASVSLLAAGLGVVGGLGFGLATGGVASAASQTVSGNLSCVTPLGVVSIPFSVHDTHTMPTTVHKGTTFTAAWVLTAFVTKTLIHTAHIEEPTKTTLPVTDATLHVTKVGFSGPTKIVANNTPVNVPINATTLAHGYTATITYPATEFTALTTLGSISLTPGGVTLYVLVGLTCFPPGITVTTTTPIRTTGSNTNPPVDYATAGAYITPPTITSFTPTTGSTLGGTTVTITGTNFSGATAVKFGTTSATTFTVTSTTKIVAKTKAHAAGTVKVKVSTPGGTGTSTGNYTFAVPPAPTITSITPTTGSTSGGTTVTIVGTHLYGATTVAFGSLTISGTHAASFRFTGTTKIIARTEVHAAGGVKVRVKTVGGTAASSSNFTYSATSPTITSFTPTSGTTLGGTTVTITGTKFTTTASHDTVKFGTTTATSIHVTSTTKIVAKTKAHPAGTVKISVKVTGKGTATSSGFYKFVPPVPTITSFTPTTGSTSGGTTVTITGTSFTGATSVKFGTTPATTFRVTSSTKITAKTKPHAAGTVKVKVTNPGGSATSTGNFGFVASTPTITSFTPTSGSTAGGTLVTITGTNLYKANGHIRRNLGTSPPGHIPPRSSPRRIARGRHSHASRSQRWGGRPRPRATSRSGRQHPRRSRHSHPPTAPRRRDHGGHHRDQPHGGDQGHIRHHSGEHILGDKHHQDHRPHQGPCGRHGGGLGDHARWVGLSDRLHLRHSSDRDLGHPGQGLPRRRDPGDDHRDQPHNNDQGHIRRVPRHHSPRDIGHQGRPPRPPRTPRVRSPSR